MNASREPSRELGSDAGYPVAGEALTPNLLNDLDSLATLLAASASRQSWLDAYLLSAGLVQIADDWLDGATATARAASRMASRLPAPVALAARAGVGGAEAVAGARRLTASWRAATRWRDRAAALVDELAAFLVGHETSTDSIARAAAVAAGARLLPVGLRRSLVRLPAVFHGFDLTPADLERLAVMFAGRHPQRGVPVAVIGVRTSGSYTAPLIAAVLRGLGYRRVAAATHRPGEGWPATSRRNLCRVADQGGLAIVSDDPPSSGKSVARTARELEKLGFPSDRIVPLLPVLQPSGGPPGPLTRYPFLLLHRPDWAIDERLSVAAVERDLGRLVGMHGLVHVGERVPAPGNELRRHARELYRVKFGLDQERLVLVQGVGLGCFGWLPIAVAGALGHHQPRVYGIEDGLLYREWLPEAARLPPVRPAESAGVARQIATYVAERARTLAIEDDVTQRLGRRGSVWKRSGDLLARGFGRAQEPARPVMQSIARHLLRAERAAVIDGSTGLSHWFQDGAGGLLKVDADERAFSSRDLHSCDPAFDLAGAAAGVATEFGDELKAAYAEIAGDGIDAERWLLYQLVHLEDRLPAGPLVPVAQRRLARLLQAYYASVVFADTSAPAVGPLCAIDLDGVLETPGLGFPGLTPSAAFALRALARHGYRVFLATGRSLREVRDRCLAYPVAGGVAEYGAVVYDSAGERACRLLTAAQSAALAGVRHELAGVNEVHIDLEYRSSVRAYLLDAHGRPQSLPARLARLALDRSGSAPVRVIEGAGQSDFVPVGVDKAGGVNALAAWLGDATPLAMAVGDSAADLPMLAAAKLALAPANADRSVREAGVRILREPCQLGFAQAVSALLGHRPGGCRICRPGVISPRSRLLLAALAGSEPRGAGKLGALARAVLALRAASAG